MVIRSFNAPTGAPAIATNISTTFDDDLESGTVNFTAPTKTVDGQTLTGSLSYRVTDGSETLVSGSCDPGESIEADVSSTTGQHKFQVTTTNDQGTSPAAFVYKWVGSDVPEAPRNITASIDRTSGKATVTWDASTVLLHDGYSGGITYNVIRSYNGVGETVATGVKGTSYSETLPQGDLATYQYHVLAVNGTQISGDATSNSFVWGNTNNVPYYESFENPDHWNQFTVIDANHDGNTWSYVNRNGPDSYCRTHTEGPNKADDWLITPPINLQAGRSYDLTIELRSQSSTYPEKYEIKAGQGYNVSDMQYTVQSETYSNSGSIAPYTFKFTAPKSGEFNFGIHCTSEPNSWYFCIHSIKLEDAATDEGPDSVTNLTVTPAPKGGLQATIKFDAPTKSVGGSNLTKNISIDIQRDDKLLTRLEDVAPGKHVDFIDKDSISSGSHDYTITPRNGENIGMKNERRNVYVGIDAPKNVDALTLTPDDSTISAVWTPVDTIGASGGYVNTSKVEYQLWNSVLQGGFVFPYTQLTSVTGQNFATIDVNPNEGAQQMQFYTVIAANESGSAFGRSQYILAGKPYSLPFKESFAYNAASYFWAYSRSSQDVKATYSTESSDGDGSSYSFVAPSAGMTAELQSGKIDIQHAVVPVLSFDVKETVNGNPLDVIIVDQNGLADTISVDPPTTSFTKEEVDLSPYVDSKFIRFFIHSTFNTNGSIFIDNLRVDDKASYSIAINSVSAPEEATIGDTVNVSVNVANIGTYPIKDYELKAIFDGETVADTTVSDAIFAGNQATIDLPFKPSLFSKEGKNTVKVVLTQSLDQKTDDNEATADFYLSKPGVASPEDLTLDDSKQTTASWKAPSVITERHTDDFESYEAGSINQFGPWTTIDVDSANCGSLIMGTPYPHQYTPFAYFMWNPNAIDPFILTVFTDMTPHSGQQCPSTVYSYNDSTFVVGDNWLISPELPGTAQTISFWETVGNRNYTEDFEVLASSTDTKKESFSLIDSGSTEGKWVKRYVDLPEGTRYFAIREHTVDHKSFMLMLDDISYSTESNDIYVTGYNVYIDKKLVGTATSSTTTFDLGSLSGNHEIEVTALYSNGIESAPAVATYGNATAIDSVISNEAGNFDVYTVGGIRVRHNATSLDGLPQGVYIVNGKKYVK